MRVKQIGPLELSQILGEGKLILLDVRESHEVAFCQIDGSVHLPLRQINEAQDRFQLETPIVVYCHHGPRSQMACEVLMAQGFEDVTNLEGGIDSWSRSVDSKIPRY